MLRLIAHGARGEQEMRVILVTGATGNVGAEVLRALTRAGESVRALVRDASKGDLPAEVEVVEGDLDEPGRSLEGARRRARRVPAAGLQGHAGVLAAIRGAGVERVVLLSGTSAASGDTSNAVTAYMMRSEAAVRDSGVPWTILRAYALMSNTLRWTEQLQQGDAVSEPFADVPVAMVDPFDIGEVAARALTSDAHEGRTYIVSGGEAIVPADRVRILGKVLQSRPAAARAVERRGARADELVDAGGVRRCVLRLLRRRLARRVAAAGDGARRARPAAAHVRAVGARARVDAFS